MCAGSNNNGWSRARGLVVKTLVLIGGAILVKRSTKSTTRWDHARIVSQSLAGEKFSRDQASRDPDNFFNLRWLSCPAAEMVDGSKVLYFEQAFWRTPNKPFRQRFYMVKPCPKEMKCDVEVCGRKILSVGGEYNMVRGYTSVGQMVPFYVFPCGHAFHAQCLIAHVMRCTDQTQAECILDLQKQLTLLGSEPKQDINGGLTGNESTTSMMTPVDKIRSQLDDAIAGECPFCGDLMIWEISLPFILPEEAHEVTSWEINPQNLGSQRSFY